MENLEGFLKTLALHYANDVIAPGVVVAWLKDRGTFYYSVRRYALTTERVIRANVVVTYESTTAQAAFEGLVRNWRRSTGGGSARRARKLPRLGLEIPEKFREHEYERLRSQCERKFEADRSARFDESEPMFPYVDHTTF